LQQARIAAGVAETDARVAFTEIRDFSIAAAMASAYAAADVMVCARPDFAGPEWREAFESTLIGARVPCVVARSGAILSGQLALAWDGGGPARRALHAAMPLIRSVGSVVVLHAPDGLSVRQREIAAPEALCTLMVRQGVSARVQPVAGKAADGIDLLDTARGLNVSLLICGAYGHTRAQEFFFGGATRSFLAAEQGPSLFLAH
jgi:nucleotide-binding universal stress UspA family protein